MQALFFSAFLRIKDHENGGKEAWQSRKHQSRKGKGQRTGDGGKDSALFSQDHSLWRVQKKAWRDDFVSLVKDIKKEE